MLFISKASKFKHAALALGAASLMAVQAQATEVQAQSPQAVPVATFSQSDLNTLFDQAEKPMQLAALSGQEMKETEGAFGWWGAAFGGLGGFGGFFLNNRISGSSWSWTGAGAATFAGARAGATAGPVGVVWGFNSAIGGGTALGVAQRRGW